MTGRFISPHTPLPPPPTPQPSLPQTTAKLQVFDLNPDSPSPRTQDLARIQPTHYNVGSGFNCAHLGVWGSVPAAAEEPQVRFADVGCGFGGLLGESEVIGNRAHKTKDAVSVALTRCLTRCHCTSEQCTGGKCLLMGLKSC